MSRTLKDARQEKEQRIKKEPMRRRYRKYKQNGFVDDQCFENNCPECNSPTEYSGGVLLCGDCDWNSAGVKTLNFNNSIFKKAA